MAACGKVKGLRGAIFSRFDSEAAFARYIRWTRQKLYKITSGLTEPDVNDLNDLANGLGLTVGEVAQFFLDRESPNGQQEAS